MKYRKLALRTSQELLASLKKAEPELKQLIVLSQPFNAESRVSVTVYFKDDTPFMQTRKVFRHIQNQYDYISMTWHGLTIHLELSVP